jgi:hypothetical protein
VSFNVRFPDDDDQSDLLVFFPDPDMAQHGLYQGVAYANRKLLVLTNPL